MSKKPVTKGAAQHRQQPSGGPSGGGSSGSGGSGSGSGGSTSNTPSSGTGADPMSETSGGGTLSGLTGGLSSGQKRKLMIAGAAVAAVGVAYFVLKSRGGSDRGNGERVPDDGDDGGDDPDGEVAGYPSITQDPEDPLAADEEALEWLNNPPATAGEVEGEPADTEAE